MNEHSKITFLGIVTETLEDNVKQLYIEWHCARYSRTTAYTKQKHQTKEAPGNNSRKSLA